MIKPGIELEKALNVFGMVMKYANIPNWLCFGGLWGLIRNGGVVPDDDLDFCTYYGHDYKKILKVMDGTPGGYRMSKVMLCDISDYALYMHFENNSGLPNICLSFWYPNNGNRYYCHDQANEIHGVGVPASGYFFKGVPADATKALRLVEWPGVPQMTKVSVPQYPGWVLDNLYPNWAYQRQRYNVKPGQVDQEHMKSYHRGGAMSPFMVHVKSMREFDDQKAIDGQLRDSKSAWNKTIKEQSY